MKNLLEPDSGPDLIIPVLGILPLLIVANSFENATAIGMVNLVAIVTTGIIIATLRNLLPLELRLVVILLVAASVLSIIYVGMQFWFYALSQQLGIYIPLIAVNFLLLGWTEEYALRNGIIKTALHTMQAGLGVLVIVIVIGLIREYAGLSLLKQPAGAFLVLGLLIALYNVAGNRQQQSG